MGKFNTFRIKAVDGGRFSETMCVLPVPIQPRSTRKPLIL